MSSMFCYSHGGTRYLGACTGEPGLDGSAMELRSLRSVVVAEPPGRVPAKDALGDSQPLLIGAPGDVGTATWCCFTQASTTPSRARLLVSWYSSTSREGTASSQRVNPASGFTSSPLER